MPNGIPSVRRRVNAGERKEFRSPSGDEDEAHLPQLAVGPPAARAAAGVLLPFGQCRRHECRPAGGGPGPQSRRTPAGGGGRGRLTLAESLEKNGQEADAIAQYKRARHKDPHLSDAVSRAWASSTTARATGAGPERVPAGPEALAARPGPAQRPGLQLLQPRPVDRGREVPAASMAVDKKHQRAWMNLAMALAQQGRDEESLEAFARVVSPAEAQANLAFLLTTQGKFAEARQAYRRALALEPNLSVARPPWPSWKALGRRSPSGNEPASRERERPEESLESSPISPVAHAPGSPVLLVASSPSACASCKAMCRTSCVISCCKRHAARIEKERRSQERQHEQVQHHVGAAADAQRGRHCLHQVRIGNRHGGGQPDQGAAPGGTAAARSRAASGTGPTRAARPGSLPPLPGIPSSHHLAHEGAGRRSSGPATSSAPWPASPPCSGWSRGLPGSAGRDAGFRR